MQTATPAIGHQHSRQLLWLALAMTPQLGPTRARKLRDHFGGVEQVFRASLTELEAAGLHAASAQSIHNRDCVGLAEEELLRVSSFSTGLPTGAGAALVSLEDDAYPPLLRQIYDPPIVLYVRGSVEALRAGRAGRVTPGRIAATELWPKLKTLWPCSAG